MADTGENPNVADAVDAEVIDAGGAETTSSSGAQSASQSAQAGEKPTTSIGGSAISINKIQKIKVRVQAMLGGVSMSVSELANLKQGELIALDTKVGEAIDILANGQVIARGEIVVVEEATPKFGITLTEIVDTSADAA